ncbi:MAG: murein biosynthesis integral membrane protein MurJ [Gemmatimonadales bacterium]
MARAAPVVAAGILASRIVGLVRQRVIAHYFGQATDSADALAAAFRIPNVLQNLFGEGVLSASLIPEYTKLRATGQDEEAERLAGAVAGLLAVAMTLLVAAGVLLTPWLIDVLQPGFDGARRELAIGLVRIIFPGVGLLVLSAWCLGILNSHRRFFLSYAAPVVWNLAIIVTTIAAATRLSGPALVVWTAWGSVIGAALQLLVQLPLVARLLGGIRPTLRHRSAAVRRVVVNFMPAALSRGVVQVSAYVDGAIAGLLPIGGVAALTNAQVLYTLPVSLFGMSIAAAELPELSTEAAGSGHTVADALRERLARASRQVAFFVVPSVIGLAILGGLAASVVFQSGRFTADDVRLVWATLAGASVGLLAVTLGRLYNSAHYALGDTRTPFRYASLRVLIGIPLGLAAALWLPDAVGVAPRWGTAGLTLAGGLAGWLEYSLLRRSLVRRLGAIPFDWALHARLWPLALAAAGLAWLLARALGDGLLPALVSLAAYGILYLTGAALLGLPMVAAIRRRFGAGR